MMPGFESRSARQAMAHVVEECGEVLSAAGKTFRFGPYSVNPLIPEDQRETNLEWFHRELRDLELSIAAYWNQIGEGK